MGRSHERTRGCIRHTLFRVDSDSGLMLFRIDDCRIGIDCDTMTLKIAGFPPRQNNTFTLPY